MGKVISSIEMKNSKRIFIWHEQMVGIYVDDGGWYNNTVVNTVVQY